MAENDNGFLIVDYTDDNHNPILNRVFNEEDLFKIIDYAKERKIVVFKIGKCLVDWS